jgi:hypothetical protein
VKKNIVKIALDTVMILLLILMYNAKVISITFHELGGLIVCGLFLIHKALNIKWITRVTQRLFDKTLPLKTKVGYAVDALLLIAVTFIAVSGIMISKVLFSGTSSGILMKPLHYFAAAVAIVLVGIHLGLHWDFIAAMFKRRIRLPRSAAITLSALFLTAIISYGAYSMAMTRFTAWIAAPFSSAAVQDSGLGKPGGQTPGNGMGHGGEGGGFKDGGEFHGTGAPGTASVNFTQILSVVASFGSIVGCFAAATYWLDRLANTRRKRRRPDTATS